MYIGENNLHIKIKKEYWRRAILRWKAERFKKKEAYKMKVLNLYYVVS